MNEEAKIRKFEEVLERAIEKSASYYDALSRALGSIKKATKKDGKGGAYANFERNFYTEAEGVYLEWEKDTVFKDGRQPTLRIHYTYADGKRDLCYLNTYRAVDEREEEYAQLEAEGRIVKGGWGIKDFYNFTPDEVLENIRVEQERAERRRKSLDDRREMLHEKGVEIVKKMVVVDHLKQEIQNTEGVWESSGWLAVSEALEAVGVKL